MFSNDGKQLLKTLGEKNVAGTDGTHIAKGGVHHVVPGEGGHADFAPQDEEQTGLFLHLHRQYGHVSSERVISGMRLASPHGRPMTGTGRRPVR